MELQHIKFETESVTEDFENGCHEFHYSVKSGPYDLVLINGKPRNNIVHFSDLPVKIEIIPNYFKIFLISEL